MTKYFWLTSKIGWVFFSVETENCSKIKFCTAQILISNYIRTYTNYLDMTEFLHSVWCWYVNYSSHSVVQNLRVLTYLHILWNLKATDYRTRASSARDYYCFKPCFLVGYYSRACTNVERVLLLNFFRYHPFYSFIEVSNWKW